MTRRFRENGCGLVVQYVVLKGYVKCTKCASGSVVEHHLAKVGAAGSNPVSRFFYWLELLDFSRISAILHSLKIGRQL